MYIFILYFTIRHSYSKSDPQEKNNPKCCRYSDVIKSRRMDKIDDAHCAYMIRVKK